MRKSFPLKRTSFSWGFWPLLLFFSLSFSNSHAFWKEGKDCPSSSCGPLHKISYPFCLKGISRTPFELTCENNYTKPVFHLPPRRYYIQEISSDSWQIRLLDPGLANSSLPLYNSSPSFLLPKAPRGVFQLHHPQIYRNWRERRLVLVNCSQAVNEPSYVATAPCNLSSPHAHVYAMAGHSISASQLHINCAVLMNLPIISDEIEYLTSCSGIHELLMRGFYVEWTIPTDKLIYMLAADLVGRRKNIDAFAEHSSQIYFPLWVYDQLHKGKELVMADIADNDKETAKKMMIVALWCIQLIPTKRPSMSKVIEMLAGRIEDLHMPPKPLLSSPQTLDGDHSHN